MGEPTRLRRDDYVVDRVVFGARVKARRDQLRMRREDVTGVPYNTLQAIEQGRNLPNLDTAYRIAVALNVSLDHLVGLCSAAGCCDATHATSGDDVQRGDATRPAAPPGSRPGAVVVLTPSA